MASAITGDHDASLEVSESVLTALLSERLVGVTRFGASAIRIGSLKAVALDATAGGARVEIRAKVIHGTLRAPWTTGTLVLRRLRMTLRMVVSLALDLSGGAVALRVDLGALTAQDVSWTWDWGAAADIAAQAAAQGVTWSDTLEEIALALLVAELKKQSIPSLPVPGLAYDAGADAFPSASPVTFRALELTSRAKGPSSPSAVVLVGTFLSAHAGGSASKKTRVALGLAHGVAVALSPEALRDGVVCPMLARFFGTTAQGLCPACGSGSVSLSSQWGLPVVSRLDLTSIDVRCEPGEVVIVGAVDGAGPAFTLRGSLTLRVTFTLDPSGTRLVPHVALDPVSLSIDTNDVLDVFTLGATQILASKAADLFKGIAKGMFESKIKAAPPASIPLPAAPGGAATTYDSVHIDGDGVVLFAKVALAPKVLAAPTCELAHTLSERRVRVGEGTGGATCFSSGYAYVDDDVAQTHAYALTTSGLEPIVSRAWDVNGLAIASSGNAITLAADNSGEGTDANDDAIVVDVGLSPARDALTIQNRASDGNYLLGVKCVVDDGVDVYTAYEVVSIDGQQRVWDPRYGLDAIRCAARTVSLKRHIRWPASDPPGEEYPAPWERWFDVPRPVNPWDVPEEGPWSHSLLAGWFRRVEGGVVRTTAGQAVLAPLVNDEERVTLLDTAGLRRLPRAVAPVIAPERVRTPEVAPAPIERVDVPVHTPVSVLIRERIARPVFRPR